MCIFRGVPRVSECSEDPGLMSFIALAELSGVCTERGSKSPSHMCESNVREGEPFCSLF